MACCWAPKRGLCDPKRYQILQLIGQGAFGSVYKAKDLVSGESVAIKKIEMDEAAEKELAINIEIGHPNVVTLLGHFQEKREEAPLFVDLCLVLEFCEMSLDDFIKKHYLTNNERMSTHVVQLLSFQMFRALNYLHSKRIIHRDVKPSNFLIDTKSKVLKIADFGLSKMVIEGEAMTAGMCTKPYKPPEVELGSRNYTEKIDIWSAACIVAECASGEVLFRQVENVQHWDLIRNLLGDPTEQDVAELPMRPVLVGPRRPPAFDERFAHFRPPVPQSITAFLKKTLQYRSSKRPSAIEILADEFYDPLRALRGLEDILYDFFEEEVAALVPALLERIVPPEYRNEAIKQRLRSVATVQPPQGQIVQQQAEAKGEDTAVKIVKKKIGN